MLTDLLIIWAAFFATVTLRAHYSTSRR